MKNIDLRVEGYYTDTDNYISSESHAYPKVYYSDNIDKVWTKGIEIDLNTNTRFGMEMYVNYNFYLVDWYDDSLEIEPFLMELTPKHRFKSGISYSFVTNTKLVLESSAVMGRRSKSGLEMDDYVVFGCGVEQQLINRRLLGNLRVVNITDIDYQEIYGYPMPNRTILLNISVSL